MKKSRVFFILLAVAACAGGEKGSGDIFKDEILPELSLKCASKECHGMGSTDANTGRFLLPAQGEPVTEEEIGKLVQYFVTEKSVGSGGGYDHSLFAPCSVERFKTGKLISFSDDPRLSLLLRKPLAITDGGLPHAGGAVYQDRNDPAYQALENWVFLAVGESDFEPQPLDESEMKFKPLLEEMIAKGCAAANCHGPSGGSGFIVDSGVGGLIGDELIRANFKEFSDYAGKGWGEPVLSRFVRKTSSGSLGGIQHKGNKDIFGDKTAGNYQNAVELIKDINGDGGSLTGIVFVRSKIAPRNFFSAGEFQGPSDIFLLKPASPDGELTNLTDKYHTYEADVRDPAVSYDGERIVFAMRKSSSECMNIYSMNAGGADLKQITDDKGCTYDYFSTEAINATNATPVYGPDGRIYFASTRLKNLNDHGDMPSVNIFSVNEDGSDLRQETFGFGIDLDPSFLSDGRMIFTSMRGIGLYNGASIAALGKDGYFPLFGENSKYTIFAYPSELPDGRIAVILMDTANRWEGGAVGLIDLSLGADIESKLIDSAAVKDYIKPLVQASAATVSYKDQSPQGFFREISPLPDGRLLVSYSKKTMNLKMDAPEPDTAIYFAEIIQNEETEKPSLKLIEPALADAEGMNDSDPVGIFARKKPEILEKPDGTEKVLKIPDAAMFQSILMNNAPVKRSDLLREDIEFVRVISQLPPALEEHEPLLNPLNTKKAKNNDPFSTLISNGIFKKRLILGTAPVEKDGSVNIRIKSGMPVTFQFLNAEGFAVGEEIGRWFYFTGGGEVSFGVKRENYELECASCHGTLDGSKKETGVFPDDAVNYESSAGSKEAFELTEARGVDFKTRIQTLMMLKCAYGGCHDNAGKSGGLDLTESGDGGYNGMYSNGYENLMVLGEGSGIELEEKPWLVNGSPWKKAYVDERNARAIRSYLMEKILNEELDAPKGLSGGQCKANEIDDQEKELFKDWIDLGATFLGL